METVERWVDVVGYEGRYSISDQGRVRTNLNGRRSKAGDILTPRAHSTKNAGFLIFLAKDSKKKSFLLHRLVAEHFLEPSDDPKKNTIGWRNEDRGDCRVSNLYWKTKNEAMQAYQETVPKNTARNGWKFIAKDERGVTWKHLPVEGVEKRSSPKTQTTFDHPLTPGATTSGVFCCLQQRNRDQESIPLP